MGSAALHPRRSLRADAPMYAGVFFIFGGLGMLVAMIQPTPGGWVVGVVTGVFGGVIAITWAAAFSMRKYWLLIPANVAPFVVPQYMFAVLGRTGILNSGYGLEARSRLLILALMMIVCVSVGFVLLLAFVRSHERAGAHARAELDVAQRIHKRLVPPIDAAAAGVHVLARSHASSEMGGDLVDVLMRDREADVFLADVSGHGVGAGIVMGMVKSCIRTRLRERPDLGALLNDLNAVLTDLTEPSMFATFACVRWNQGRVEYALAGHLPILVYRAERGEVVQLPNEHLPLGITQEEVFHAGSTELKTGDTIAIFTDGLTEVQDSKGRELGLRAFVEVFARHAKLPLQELHDELLNAARGHGRQLDDQSMVLLRVD